MTRCVVHMTLLAFLVLLSGGCQAAGEGSSGAGDSSKLSSQSAKAQGVSQPSESALPRLPAIVSFQRNAEGFAASVVIRHGGDSVGPSKVTLLGSDDHGNSYTDDWEIYGSLTSIMAQRREIFPKGFTYVLPFQVPMPQAAPLTGMTIIERHHETVRTQVPVHNGQPVTVPLSNVQDLNRALPNVLAEGAWGQVDRFVQLRLLSKPQVFGDTSLAIPLEFSNSDYNAKRVQIRVGFGQLSDGRFTSLDYRIGGDKVQVFCGDTQSGGLECNMAPQTSQPVTIRINSHGVSSLELVMVRFRAAPVGVVYPNDASGFLVPVR